MRQLQLSVNMFNELNAYIIFTFKLYCISAAVICGFGAIACYHYSPVFGLLSAAVCIHVSAMYVIVYKKAFAVPEGIVKVKKAMTVQIYTTRFGAKRERDDWVKTVESIRIFGIHVGCFHAMERASVPNFIDFVVRNVVSLLVAAR